MMRAILLLALALGAAAAVLPAWAVGPSHESYFSRSQQPGNFAPDNQTGPAFGITVYPFAYFAPPPPPPPPPGYYYYPGYGY